MVEYVTRDGQRLTPKMLAVVNAVDAAFYAKFKLHLLVSSGVRTYEEQKAIFLARYTRTPGTQKVYDTRIWDGVKWYRISSAGTVAVPGTSNHEIQGTKAAVDLRDTGTDAGVTRAGTTRANWLKANAASFGMVASGYGFGEPWHYDVLNVLDGTAPAGSAGGGTVWDEEKKQRFLTQIGLDTGGIGNGWGPKSDAATRTFQGWVGLTVDGKFGPDTIGVAEIIIGGGNYTSRSVSDIQTAFQKLGLPVGAIDGAWGLKASLCTYMVQIKHGLTHDAKYGKLTDAVVFPVTTTPTPTPTTVPGKNATSRPLTQIQAFLKVPTTGVWDQATSDAVAAFQTTQGILVDHVWGNASDGLAFPPAGSLHGIDYSFSRPSPALLASRGVKHVGRYLHDSSKGLTRSEYDALRAAGINVWLIFERDGKELLGGFSAGVECANIAEGQRNSLGLPAQPIYFNVDYDAPDSDMPKILDALSGAASVIGAQRVGLYGSYRVIKAAFDAGKIAWGFQTYAWSAGQWEARAQLQQWANGQWGGTVDFTRAMAAEYGQHAVSTTEEPEPSKDMISVPRAELERIQAVLNGWLA